MKIPNFGDLPVNGAVWIQLVWMKLFFIVTILCGCIITKQFTPISNHFQLAHLLSLFFSYATFSAQHTSPQQRVQSIHRNSTVYSTKLLFTFFCFVHDVPNLREIKQRRSIRQFQRIKIFRRIFICRYKRISAFLVDRVSERFSFGFESYKRRIIQPCFVSLL